MRADRLKLREIKNRRPTEGFLLTHPLLTKQAAGTSFIFAEAVSSGRDESKMCWHEVWRTQAGKWTWPLPRFSRRNLERSTRNRVHRPFGTSLRPGNGKPARMVAWTMTMSITALATDRIRSLYYYFFGAEVLTRPKTMTTPITKSDTSPAAPSKRHRSRIWRPNGNLAHLCYLHSEFWPVC